MSGLAVFSPGPRWVPSRKSEVVRQVREGVITFDRARKMHGLTIDELATWITDEARAGRRGLHVTKPAVR